MPKADLSWQEHKGKQEDSIVIIHPGKWGPFEIPAREFHDISRKGMSLLREHNYGAFVNEKEISLEIKKGRDPADQYIASIYVNDEHIIDIWFDRITRYGPHSYCFYMKGENIGGIYSEKVKFAEELKEFIFQA